MNLKYHILYILVFISISCILPYIFKYSKNSAYTNEYLTLANGAYKMCSNLKFIVGNPTPCGFEVNWNSKYLVTT